MPRTSLLISDLRRDDGTQIRVAINHTAAGEYAQSLQNGEMLPDPVVFQEGKHFRLADGFHTVYAHEINGEKRVYCDLRPGTLRDAILYAAGANAKHGLQRTPDDVRRAVLLLLKDEEWGKNPNTWIAERVGISAARVGQIKKGLRKSETESILGTQEVEHWDEAAEIEKLTPEQRAAWDGMSQQQQEGISERSEVDSLDQRVRQIEDLVRRIIVKLGESETAKAIRSGLRCYADKVRLTVGWERSHEPEVSEELLTELKPLVDQIRRKHQGLPGERQLTRKLEAIWEAARRHLPRRSA